MRLQTLREANSLRVSSADARNSSNGEGAKPQKKCTSCTRPTIGRNLRDFWCDEPTEEENINV